MNFQVSPLGLPGRIALFRPRLDDLWRSPSSVNSEESFVQKEVVSVMSTDSGHFLLVLEGDELVTIRDVCRNQSCEFVGVFPHGEIQTRIKQQIDRLKEPRSAKPIFF